MPRKRIRSASPEGQPSKKAKSATGKTSTNTTKDPKATAAKPTAQVGTPEDDQNTATEALARKPAGRPAAGSKPSARGRKKANDKVNPESGEQGNFQPAIPARAKQQNNAKTNDTEANPDDDAPEAKDGGLTTATNMGDSIEVALDPWDSEEDATNVLSHAKDAPTRDRTSEGIKSANLADAAAGNTTSAISQDIQAARQEVTTTAAGPLAPTHGHGSHSDGQRLGGDGGLSSCDSEEKTGEEDPIMAGLPFHPIQWQRPVPSRVSASGTTATIRGWARPLAPKPMDALPTVEKRSSSPSLHRGDTDGSRVTEPLSEADASHQQPLPSRQQETTTSAGVVTEQPFIQQPSLQQPYIRQSFVPQPVLQPASQPMNVDSNTKPGEIHEPSGLPQAPQPVTVGSNMKPGETPEPFGHNTAPVHITADHSGSGYQSLAKVAQAIVMMDHQQAPQPVTVGSNMKPGETPKPFGHNTAPVHTTADNPGPVSQSANMATLNVDVSRLPMTVFNSLDRFLNDDLPATSAQGLWLRGVQCGIGHGLATLKRIFLSEIEERGSLFGHPFPLKPGQTRSEQRKAIEANVMFDRVVANHAGETFMKSQSKWRKHRRRQRRHGSAAAAAAAPPVSIFQQAPMTFGAPAGHMNPGPTPTPPILPHFQPNPMSVSGSAAPGPTPTPPILPHFQPNPMRAGGSATPGPHYPQYPGSSRPPVGPWMNPPSNVTAAQNYNIGVEKKPEDGAFPEFTAFVNTGIPQRSARRGG